MSPLKSRITEDMKSAMRARDTARLLVIRMLLAACKQREVDERIELDDAAVVGLVDKLIKQRRDSVAAFQIAARDDLVAIETAEIAVLEIYLPQRLDAAAIDAEVAKLVAGIASDLGHPPGPAEMGRVMAAAKAAFAGKAEMGTVSASVKRALSQSNS
ncbi:MAG: GatB/YqeY domain-containing protein [Rubrivivax sp.]